MIIKSIVKIDIMAKAKDIVVDAADPDPGG